MPPVHIQTSRKAKPSAHNRLLEGLCVELHTKPYPPCLGIRVRFCGYVALRNGWNWNWDTSKSHAIPALADH